MISTAYDPRSARTVFAWTIHLPGSIFNRRIAVSFGMMAQDLLTLPVFSQWRSGTSPGVACRSGGAVGPNCIIAFANDEDSLSRVWVQRFSGAQTGVCARSSLQCFEPAAGSGTILPDSTGDDVAAWFAGGRFWIAIRSVEPGQPTHTWHSRTGDDWRRGPDLPASIVGPAVQNSFEVDGQRVVIVNE